uniref:Cytochrome P450, family 2, subfamily X, polypeptide 7 n=1 Tax=Scleropages formosus TaxID=113540 RepID=A0A8C9V5R9_SCLFO
MLGTLILLWVGFWLLLFLFRTRRPKNFPPGPWPVPIFGNLLQLNLANPIKDLGKLSERYGKVFSLYFGERPAVVLNGLQAMKEAMVIRAVDFAGRPLGMMVTHLGDGKGIVMADYSPSWKEHRRFALMTLRNFGLGKKSLEDRILEEISYVTTLLERSDGKSINPQILFHKAASNIICSILFGNRYEHDDEFLQRLLKIFREITTMVNGPWTMLYDTLPFLKYFQLPFKKTFENMEILKKIAADQIAQHKSTQVPEEPRDFIDCYLDEMEKRGEGFSLFNESQLIILCVELHIAGTDTISNTLLTAYLYLTTHPDVQARCQQEIDAVLGDRAHASFEDRHKMPYVQAMIHEVQRMANIIPLSVFHRTTKDTQLMGYNIPKGTLIIQNLTSVLYEESQWKFPHDFNPSNFLNEQGEFVKPEAFMPFSAGCADDSSSRPEYPL